MPMIAATFFCGLLFGAGLMVSEMSQPAKVLNFLDLFGTWDPSLALVMASALAVSAAGYAFAKRSTRPLFSPRHLWPTKADIDPPLVLGATLFGVGWGLVGLCPGPALVNLATLSPQVIVFVACMAGGMVLHDRWSARREAAAAASADG
jgi:uncharacterized membrane protein YedE/YeeE